MSAIDYHLFAVILSSIFADRYEVLFFDGFTKNLKGVRMSKLEGETDKIEEVRLNVVIYFSSFYYLSSFPEFLMKCVTFL
jgi:hypothetical protein